MAVQLKRRSVLQYGSALAACLALAPAAGAALFPAPSPRASELPTFASAARLKEATGEELVQFHNELERAGWRPSNPVRLPSTYRQRNGVVQEADYQFATFYGDVDGDRRPEWVVAYHFPVRGPSPIPNRTPNDQSATPRDERARLAVFKHDNGRWRVDWVSPGLGFEFRSSLYNLQEVGQGLEAVETLRLPVSLVDIDGDGKLEIAYHCWSEFSSVGALPGILRLTGRRWVNVAPQAERFSVQDVDGDGKLEVVTGSQRIGYGMGDDDVPRVWRWDGRQYQEASSDYPRFYAGLARRYAECVKRMEASGEKFDRAVWDRAIQKAQSLAG
jgi:hypothetical protein